jgi:endothelin-converting enzyme
MAWPETGVHSWVANARYGVELNHAVIPSGIMQDPLYYPGAPSYISYSSVGMVVGHEMTHGLDTNGRFWNQKHQFKTWWDEESIAEFDNRTACFVKQYSGMRAVDQFGDALSGDDGKPLFVDGMKTVGENMADAGGLITAWEAWVQDEKRMPSQLLPGLQEFSKEQLFFINYGQNWCNIQSASTMQAQIQTPLDGHSPGFARILGPTQNFKAFDEVWKCNKKPVCELW